MVYLLDASPLIRAKNEFYEFGRVDEYWEWLAFQAQAGHAKTPIEIYEEITAGTDDLSIWAKAHKDDILLDEAVDVALVQHVINEGYADDLTDIEIEALGRDPFLIAHAMSDPDNRKVVSMEVRNGRQRQNRSIPSVCDDLGIRTLNSFEFGRALDFRTNWQAP